MCTQDGIVGHEIDADIVTVHKTLTNHVHLAIFQRKEDFNFFKLMSGKGYFVMAILKNPLCYISC